MGHQPGTGGATIEPPVGFGRDHPSRLLPGHDHFGGFRGPRRGQHLRGTTVSLFAAAATVIIALFAGVLPASAEAPGEAPGEQPYVLNPGDLLFVSVWREDELQRELVVLPDGTISFPLAGRLAVAGRTTEDVETDISQRLKRYIPDAVVSVSVTAAQGYRVYVVGAVNKPGEFQVPRRITVMQALSLAGGLTPFAGETSITVIRREEGRPTAIAFDYSDVKRGRNIKSDIELKSGDTVVVAGESLF
jgi:polysaccharide export outer membrane protein